MVDIITKYIQCDNYNYENPNFNGGDYVHNWRKYVLKDWQKNWNKFSKREKQIIYIMAEAQANNEKWD